MLNIFDFDEFLSDVLKEAFSKDEDVSTFHLNIGNSFIKADVSGSTENVPDPNINIDTSNAPIDIEIIKKYIKTPKLLFPNKNVTIEVNSDERAMVNIFEFLRDHTHYTTRSKFDVEKYFRIHEAPLISFGLPRRRMVDESKDIYFSANGKIVLDHNIFIYYNEDESQNLDVESMKNEVATVLYNSMNILLREIMERDDISFSGILREIEKEIGKWITDKDVKDIIRDYLL